MSPLRRSALARLSPETRLRIGLAATSVLVALSLAALLTGLASLRGVPLSPAVPIGIALGLAAELLCLDLALRRVRRRLGDIDGAAGTRRGRRPSAPAPSVRQTW